jgi:hypothetical protein
VRQSPRYRQTNRCSLGPVATPPQVGSSNSNGKLRVTGVACHSQMSWRLPRSCHARPPKKLPAAAAPQGLRDEDGFRNVSISHGVAASEHLRHRRRAGSDGANRDRYRRDSVGR